MSERSERSPVGRASASEPDADGVWGRSPRRRGVSERASERGHPDPVPHRRPGARPAAARTARRAPAPTDDRDQLCEILVSGVRLAGDDADRLDLKITNAALKEMRNAFRMFAPYREIPKVTIFGSARTGPSDPLYEQTQALAAALADRGWMVVTGAGPGIMAAGIEGAGPGALDRRQHPAAVRAGRQRVHRRRREARLDEVLLHPQAHADEGVDEASSSLPGGFGTLDETFELLTLQQTGKAEPAPIVLLDEPGGTYWHGFVRFVDRAGRVQRAASTPTTPACSWSPTTSTHAVRRDHRLLPQLPLDPVGGRPAGDPAARPRRPTPRSTT